MKQSYKKATAKVVLFDNSDVVTTSNDINGMEDIGKGCEVKGNTKSQGWNGGHDLDGDCHPALYSHR